jgi:hypothetical protein
MALTTKSVALQLEQLTNFHFQRLSLFRVAEHVSARISRCTSHHGLCPAAGVTRNTPSFVS